MKVLRPKLTEKVNDSPYWSIMADDSTYSSVCEQCGVYARFVDMQERSITTRFLSLQQIQGHPNAENIFQGIMQIIGPAGLNLPLQKLVGFTCDGASVMISGNQGVLGKLRREINPKLFSTHCPPHRMILASKAAQKEIPDFVEKLVGDILFYFRDSPTRRDQFKSLLELTDPDLEYITIVQYHKIRWLSLSDCVNRLCMLLPMLVRFFEAEMRDMNNRIAVRRKSEDLHAKLEDPCSPCTCFFFSQFSIFLLILTASFKNQTSHYNMLLIANLMEPLLLDSEKNVTDDNVRPIDDMFEHFSGSEFQKHLLQCKEHSLLTERQISDAQKAMYSYLLVLGKTIEHRFPELKFMTEQLSFIDPPQRKLRQCTQV